MVSGWGRGAAVKAGWSVAVVSSMGALPAVQSWTSGGHSQAAGMKSLALLKSVTGGERRRRRPPESWAVVGGGACRMVGLGWRRLVSGAPGGQRGHCSLSG